MQFFSSVYYLNNYLKVLTLTIVSYGNRKLKPIVTNLLLCEKQMNRRSECKFLDNSMTFLCRFCKRDFVLSASHNDTQKIFHKILFIMPTHYILTPGKKWFCTNLNEKGYKNSHFNQFRCRGFARARIKIDNHMIIKIGLDWIFFHVKQPSSSLYGSIISLNWRNVGGVFWLLLLLYSWDPHLVYSPTRTRYVCKQQLYSFKGFFMHVKTLLTLSRLEIAEAHEIRA